MSANGMSFFDVCMSRTHTGGEFYFEKQYGCEKSEHVEYFLKFKILILQANCNVQFAK